MTTNIIITQQGGSSYTIAGEANYDAVGRAVIVTTLGGASGALTLMFWGYFDERHWSMGWIINGLLAGMVRWGCIVLCRIVSHPCIALCWFLCLSQVTQLLLYFSTLAIDRFRLVPVPMPWNHGLH